MPSKRANVAELGSARWCRAGDRHLGGMKTLSPAWAPCSYLCDRSSKTEAVGFESYYFYFLLYICIKLEYVPLLQKDVSLSCRDHRFLAGTMTCLNADY